MIDKIAELKNKIAAIEGHENQQAKSPVWSVLDDKISGLTQQEIAAITSSESVKNAKAEMFNAFSEFFLFGKLRDEFASIPAFRPLCDKYIGAVLDAKASMHKRVADLEEENAKLKAELAAARGQ